MALTSVIRAARQKHVGAAVTYCCRAVYSTTIRKGIFFTKKHEWISFSDNIGTVGISNYAQEALGEVVYAQLPEPGTQLAAGDECAALESVKAASEVYTPVSGTMMLMVTQRRLCDPNGDAHDSRCITEKNTAVESSPATINQSCYDAGWLFRLRVAAPEELQQLMTSAAYEEFLKDAADH